MERGMDYTGILVNTICHDGAGRFLFTKKKQQDGQGKWGFGNMVLAFGESPEEACIRCLKTEYGCIGTVERFLGVTNLMRKHDARNAHWIVLSYLLHVNPADVAMVTQAGVEHGWFHLSSPPDHIHDGTLTILQHFQRHLPSLGNPHLPAPPKVFHGTRT